MSEQEIRSTLQLARELVNHLPKEIDDKLKALILRAEDGQDPTIELEIIDFLSSFINYRRWMKEQIDLQSGQESVTRGYRPLAGIPSSVSPSQKWVCPKKTHDDWILVTQEGEDPPICKVHNIEMVRESRKKE
jgi:hypothetical protein